MSHTRFSPRQCKSCLPMVRQCGYYVAILSSLREFTILLGSAFFSLLLWNNNGNKQKQKAGLLCIILSDGKEDNIVTADVGSCFNPSNPTLYESTSGTHGTIRLITWEIANALCGKIFSAYQGISDFKSSELYFCVIFTFHFLWILLGPHRI